MTPVWAAMAAKYWLMAAWTAGSVTPWSASNTIVAELPPPRPPKSRSMMSKPCLLSTFGSLSCEE